MIRGFFRLIGLLLLAGGVRSGGLDKVLNWLNFSGTPGNA